MEDFRKKSSPCRFLLRISWRISWHEALPSQDEAREVHDRRAGHPVRPDRGRYLLFLYDEPAIEKDGLIKRGITIYRGEHID